MSIRRQLLTHLLSVSELHVLVCYVSRLPTLHECFVSLILGRGRGTWFMLSTHTTSEHTLAHYIFWSDFPQHGFEIVLCASVFCSLSILVPYVEN